MDSLAWVAAFVLRSSTCITSFRHSPSGTPDQVVAGGQYPSKEAALDASVVALREKNEEIGFVPDEHLAAVEKAIESASARRLIPMTLEYWERLRQLIRDAAAGKHTV